MTDVIDDFLDGKPVGAPKRYKPNLTADDARALATTAQELGIDPVDLATVISYETGGTFNPDQRGPTTKWGQHRGLIQFGEPQRQKYGVRDGMSFAEQLPAVSAYLRDSGVKPGMGILDVYSAIDAGRPGRYNASDAAAGGAPGTVADKVNNQMGGHRKRAESWLGMIGIGSAGAAERGSADDIDAFLDAPVAAAPATPAITGEMRAYEPTFLDSISGAFDTLVGNRDGSFKRSPIARFTDAAGQVVDAITPDAFQRGIRRGEQGFLAATGGMMPATVLGPDADRAATAAQIGSLEREAGRYPQDPGRQAALGRISGAPDLRTAVGEAVQNPGAIADVILESLGVAAPQLAATAVSGGPVGGALVTGAGSFGTEYGQTVLQAVQEAAGGDLQNVEAVSAALGNPELMAAARASAAKRGVPIAVFDALTAGLAGQIIKRARGIGQGVAAAGGEAALQAGGGMAGEATAQLSDKGQITSPGDVVLEGIAEVPTAAIEVPANLAHARANAEAAARVDAAPTSEIAPETLRAGNENLAQAQAVDSFLDEPAAPAQQAEPAPTAEPQTQPQPQTSADVQQPAAGPDVATQGEQPGQADPATAATTNAPAQLAEPTTAAAPKPEGWTNRGNGQSRANESDSRIDNTVGGIYLEARRDADDRAPLQMWVTKDGSLKERRHALSAEGENVNLWQDGTPEQKAAVIELLRKRNEHPVGSDGRKAIDAQIKEIVTGSKAPASATPSGVVSPEPATVTPPGQAAPAPAGAPVGAPVAQPPAGAGQPAMRFSSRSGSGTVSYNHLPDGRVRRTIVYDDGETFIEWLVTKKNGDEVWASINAYEKNELYPVQVPENRLQTLIDDDLSSFGVVQRESAAAPQAEPVAAAGAASAFKRTVFRGSGRADKRSVYNGTDVPILGGARYYANDEETAGKFGPDIERSDVELKNPLVIDDGAQWRSLTREAGWPTPNPHGLPAEQVAQMTARLQEIIKSRGHDGVVVDFDPKSPYDIDRGKDIKLLRNVFGDPQVAVFERAQPADAEGDVAPLLEQTNDRPDVPARPEAAPQGGGNAAPREAAQLEDGGQGPEQSTRRGKGRDEFTQASFTNRRSWKQDAFRAAGLNPDEAELLPVGKQFEAVAGALKDKFGITAQMGNKAIGRMALDQVLDLYRNAQIMAHVLGLPERAIGLGNSLTLLLRGDAPYLGAMYPGGGKVEGVDLPAGAIALPRRSNSFAHEWGHALDLFLTSRFGFPADGKLLTRKIRSEGIDFQPQSAQEAFVRLLDNLFYDQAGLAAKVMALQQAADNGTPAQQAKAKEQLEKLARGNSRLKIDGSKYKVASREYGNEVAGKAGGEYFADPAELLARAFEAYTAARVEAAGGSTEVLAKGDSAYLSDSDNRFAKTFPKLGERLQIFAAFDDLFAQLAKEQLIAQGVAAANPGNLDSFDPRKWMGHPTKEQISLYQDLRQSIKDWKQDLADKRERPKHPISVSARVYNAGAPLMANVQTVLHAIARRRKSPSADKIADLLTTRPGQERLVGRTYEERARILMGRMLTQLDNILAPLGRLNKDDDFNLSALLTNTPTKGYVRPELRDAAIALRRLSDKWFYDQWDSQIEIGHVGDGHLHRVYDVVKIGANEQAAIEKAVEVYKIQIRREDVDGKLSDEAVAEKAQKMAEAWIYNMLNPQPPDFTNPSAKENIHKHRSLPKEADEIMAEFMVSSPVERMRIYATKAARSMAFSETFGPDGKILTDLFKNLGKEGVPADEQQLIRGQVDVILGRTRSPFLDRHRGLSTALNTMHGIGTMALLSRMVMSSIAEPGAIALVTGKPSDVPKAYINMIAAVLKTAKMKEWAKIASYLSLTGESVAQALIQARLGNSYDSTVSMDKRLGLFFGQIGGHGYTNLSRVAILPIQNRHLAETAADAVRGDAAAVGVMNELGVSEPATLLAWMESIDGVPSANDLFDGNGSETPVGGVYITAMNRMNRMAIQDPTASVKSAFASTPVGRFVLALTGFNSSWWANMYRRQAALKVAEFKRSGTLGKTKVVADSVVGGAVGASAGFAIGGPVGAVLGGSLMATFGVRMAPVVATYFMTQLLVTIAREALTNPQRWEEWEKDDKLAENLFMLTLSRSFPLGLIDIPVQGYQGLKYQRDLTGMLAGPSIGFALGGIQKIVNMFTDANKPDTNNAEFSAAQGAYQIVANPLIPMVTTSLPQANVLIPLYGLANMIGTSAGARDAFATAVVGEKDSLVAKRKAAARREQKALQSGGGSVRNGDRRSSREKSDRGGTR